MIWWLAFDKKPFQFWREIWIQVVVILLQLWWWLFLINAKYFRHLRLPPLKMCILAWNWGNCKVIYPKYVLQTLTRYNFYSTWGIALVKPKVIQIHPSYYKNSNKFSQTNALFCQLPQNMTTDCSLSLCYFTTNCSERRQKFKTILCKVWGTYINVNLPYNHYVIFWVNWLVQVHLAEGV